MSPCRSARSTRTSTSSRSRSARWLVGGRGTSSRRPSASARAPSRGSSTRGRRRRTGDPASITSGPACSRTSTPASRRCAATTSPARAAGTATGCPVEIEVEKELGLTNKHEIEAFGVAEFTQRCRDSVSRYVEDWAALTERSGVWIDTEGRVLDAVERVHRIGLVDHPPDVGQGPRLRGPPRHPVLPALRHGPREPRGRAGLPGRRRPVGVRALPDHRRQARRRRPAGLDDDAVDAGLERRRRGRARHRPTCSCAAQAPGRDLVLAEAAVERLFGETRRDRRAVRRQRPRRVALRATVHDLPLDATGERVVVAPTSCRRPTARASSTSRPRSARTTRTSGAPRACRS